MDILKMIYDALIGDQEIADLAAGKIKFYEFPDSMKMDEGPYIIIEPLDVPTPSDFGDDLYLKYNVLISIETWSKNRSLTKSTSDKIESIMWDLGLVLSSGIDEFDEGVFRIAKRYRGRLYRAEIIEK
jgi:hypothetical protein